MPSFQSTRPLRGATGVVLEPLFRCFGDFNPRAPCGARLRGFMHLAQARRLFQSTRPLRGATIHSSPRHKLGRISIHAPLAGRDRTDPSHAVRVSNFNPRAPCGARLEAPRLAGAHARDFNPRAPCGARRSSDPDGVHTVRISIHAPLAGRDRRRGVVYRDLAISIHAPLAGRDRKLPAFCPAHKNFNPRAPCGARPVTFSIVLPPIVISIHAPLAGRDRFRCAIAANLTKFQSTRPLRGATLPAYINLIAEHTFQSTRPLRGATGTRLPPRYSGRYFNPRAPCGARPRLICAALCPHQHFNPRAPCGARRDARRRDHHGTVISIHAPLAGRDGM